MRTVDSNTSNYLIARDGMISRKFTWLVAKNRSTGLDETAGFWNGEFAVTIDVISGQTGSVETRVYEGAGSLLEVDDINLVSDLTIQTLRLKLTQTNAAVNNAIRGFDPRNAKVEVHYGLLDLSTRKLVSTPYPHFVGSINKAPVTRGKVGTSGSVSAEAVSRSRELTVVNPAKRSDETQKLRSSDRYRKYSGVAGTWSIFWGEIKDAT